MKESKKRNYYLTTIFLLFFSILLNAQVKISGKVTDKQQHGIENISVLVSRSGAPNILAYAITGKNGNFSIEVKSGLDSLEIRTRSLNYTDKSLYIRNRSQIVNFTLKPEEKKLKEVLVKSPAIQQRGDTLSYNVGSFAGKEDRVIADVLQKMPGIEVKESGAIHYQGKPINKYYVEGLDLMGGRYNLVNKNLPHESVSQVEILENHQPVKMLEDVIPSYNAALNIKLKKKITATGTAIFGGGFSPFLWDVKLTPMFFAKNKQTINTYQTNNVGSNVANELRQFYISSGSFTLFGIGNTAGKENLVNIQRLSAPSFSENRDLFNNIHLLNSNYLFRLKKDVDLRVNASYLDDYQKQNGTVESIYYLPDDTVFLTEKTDNELYFNSLKADFLIEKNTKKNYFTNSLKFKKHWDSQWGLIEKGLSQTEQDADNPFYELSNKFIISKWIGKRLVNFSSHISYKKAPQQLDVAPGQFDLILNDGNEYEQTVQDVNLSDFFTKNSLSFVHIKNRWTLNSQAGIEYRSQKFNSALFRMNDELPTALSDSFQNHLDWQEVNLYAEPEIHYKTERLSVTSGLSLRSVNYQIKDEILQKEQKINKILFAPKFILRYDLSAFWRLSASAAYQNNFGNIQDIHYGYFMPSYRSLQLKDVPLSQTKTQSYSIGFAYKNPLKSLFSSVRYSYSKSLRNLIFENQLQDDGSLVYSALEEEVESTRHNMFARASKYISGIKTTFSLNFNYMISQSETIINDNRSPIKSKVLFLFPKINSRIFDWLSVEYNASFSTYDNKIDNTNSSKVELQKHNLKLNIFPKDRHYLGIVTEYYDNNEKLNDLFTDIVYRFTFPKKKIDVEAKWVNVFDNSSFTDFSVGSFSVVQSTYQLRPSQFTISLKFSLNKLAIKNKK